MDRPLGLTAGSDAAPRQDAPAKVSASLAGRRGRDPFIDDEGGFTSLSVAVALLLCMALLVGATQVYWVESESSDIQFVADAAALAGENAVADFYVLARVSDAMVLSMSLLALTVYGISIVLVCIPPTIPLGLQLMQVGGRVSAARDRLGQAVRGGLSRLEEALPFLSAANAAGVVAQNSSASGSASYVGIAIPLPLSGDSPAVDGGEGSGDEVDRIEGGNDETAEHVTELDDTDRRMSESKLRAYRADCGNNPSYCMYQRASTLAALTGASNPYYSSVDGWSFSVALGRARAYYRARLAQERPADGTLDEAVRSACRQRFFSYAAELMQTGYVNEAPGSFSAYFPLLPANTDEMRGTPLYTERVWPVSPDGAIHGSVTCPGCAEGVARTASLAELESGACSECGTCRFLASTLGKVGAPSATIENGFEYHYRIVAEEAERYEEDSARRAQEEAAARDSAEDSLDAFSDALDELAEARGRYRPKPPGRHGCIAVVVDLESHESPLPSAAPFSTRKGRIGPRMAISAAALAKDDPSEGRNVISSMLEGVLDDTVESGSAAWLESAGSWLMGLWGGALQFYCDGVDAVADGIERFLDSIPFIGRSGLGGWAKDTLLGILKALGLEPLDLSTPKPVTVNSAHVLAKSNASLAEALSVARGLLGTGKMPEQVEIEGPFGSTVTVYLPEDEQGIPEAVFKTIEGVAG